MRLFSRSSIANETKTVFAWLPVRVVSMDVHVDKNVKVVRVEWLWLEYVGMRHIMQSGNYRGVEYYKLDNDAKVIAAKKTVSDKLGEPSPVEDGLTLDQFNNYNGDNK